MGRSSTLVEVLFSIILYNSCSGHEIFVSKFLKTFVFIEHADVRIPPEFTDPVMKNQECSQLCTRDYGCRKYMVTTDITTHDKLCYRYSDGENCVASTSEASNKESVCYRKLKQSDGTHCVSPVGYYGQNCEYIIKDCYDGKNNNFKDISLSYIKPADKILEVLCDFNHGMTTIQVRSSDSLEVNFTRPWNDYVNGFGNTHSEYWLGLQNIYDLTNNGVNYKLDIYLYGPVFQCQMRCPIFQLETATFSLSTSCSFGCNDDDYALLNTIFSTDQKRVYNASNCHVPVHAGWWFKDTNSRLSCTFPNLNAPRGMLYWMTQSVTDVVMRLLP